MKENLLKFAQQGVWASLSGGWYYDSHYTSFTNIFHLYIWLFLLCFPFVLYLVTPLDWTTALSYVVSLLIFFGTLKAVNSYLHYTFDCGNQVQKRVVEPEKEDAEPQQEIPTNNDPKNPEATSLNRVVEEVSLKTIYSGDDLNEERDSDDVAGHKKLWDDIESKDVCEWMKEGIVDEIDTSFNFDETWDQKQPKKERIIPSKEEMTQVHVEDESKHTVKLQKVKPTHKRHSKRRKKGTPVDKCASITSITSSSGSDYQLDGDSLQDSGNQGKTSYFEEDNLDSSLRWKDLFVEVLMKDIKNRTVDDIDLMIEFTANLKVFSTMSKTVHKTLCAASCFARVDNADTVILEDKQLLDSWSVIINGQIKVGHDDDEQVLMVGDAFGVQANDQLQYQQGRITTMCGDCEFLVVPQPVYCEAMQLENIDSEKNDMEEIGMEEKPSTSADGKPTNQQSSAFSEGRFMHRRAGFRSHIRPIKFRKLTMPDKQSPSTGDANEIDMIDINAETTLENVQPKEGAHRVHQEDDGEEGGGGDHRHEVTRDQSDILCKLEGGDPSARNSTTLEAVTAIGIPLHDVMEHQTGSFASLTSATTPSGGSLMDGIDKTPPKELFDDEAKPKQAKLMKTIAKSQAEQESSRHESGDAPSTKLSDETNFLLQSSSSFDDEAPLMKKKVAPRHSLPSGREISETGRRQDSPPTSDSDSRNVDENFRRCLQNFQKIPHIPRSASSVQSGDTPQPSTRHRLARRTRSQQPTPSDRLDPFKLTSSPPTSGRHRHPAGEVPGPSHETMKRFSMQSDGGDDEAGPSGKKRKVSSEAGVKLHLATDPTDTSEGAVHSYQDSDGNYYAYAFSSDAAGLSSDFRGADPLMQLIYEDRPNRMPRFRSRRRTGDSSSSASTNRQRSSTLDEWNAPTSSFAHEPGMDADASIGHHRLSSRRGGQRFTRLTERQILANALQRSIDARQRMPPFTALDSLPSPLASQLDIAGRPPSPKLKLFYKVKAPFRSLTIQYDRLALMDLLDRNALTVEAVLSVLLACLVGLLGLLVLSSNLLHDFWIFWLCFVMAASQYSLVKSVQPDSASPTHGHNRIIAYSRPVYFIISASLLLLCNYLSDPGNVRLQGLPLYGIKLFDNAGFVFAKNFMIIFILLLPIIFLFGLLPQINTFLIYTCEQCEIHMFGGTASTSVVASVFSVARSVFTVMLLYGFCYGALFTQERSQNILYSAFCGLLVSLSYHLSRQTSSPTVLWSIIKSKLLHSNDQTREDDAAKAADSVSKRYLDEALTERLQSDIILFPIISVLAFALHSTSMFTSLQSPITVILLGIVSVLGCFLHYIIPHLRKNLPWLLFAKPILKNHEYDKFEVTEEARLMWFEKMYAVLCFLERNILLPIYIMNELTKQAAPISNLYGEGIASVVLTVVGFKLLRSAYSVPSTQYLIYLFSYLYVNYDNSQYKDFVLITYFLSGIFYVKLQELVLKLHFFMVYISPWQMSWGSTFHAFAQPFAVPHSAIMLAQALLASLIQAPFVPFLGSAIFHSSYARPLKFWEKNYNTKRVDHSNTRLANQLERAPQPDDNNLNSVFYEHLTYSLQKSLAGDIALGRWGNVQAGDCYILASDYLNAMVHIVERGNGFITFQLRGLEFSGTYCQQREVEAINEPADTNEYCCCCYVGRIDGMLSFNSTFNQRWMAWQVIAMNYVLDGYSISDNNATTMLGVFDLRKILVSYIVKSIIYFLISHDSLDDWLANPSIVEQIEACEQVDYVEMDATFAAAIDDDFDTFMFGLTRSKFYDVYGMWIGHCCEERKKIKGKTVVYGSDSKLVSLCFAISVLGRRALGTASNNLSSNLDCFLYGLHALFKGDFRITSSKDEWVFNDMSLLQQVVAPGVRTALKLHQDHFTSPDEYEEDDVLYTSIDEYTRTMVIAHEADPVWRRAVLSNTPSLLALRRVASESYVDQYSVVTLNHRALGFNLVWVNKECVRGLWAGQQSELIFLRNRNPERGSIQNAKQVLRNMINSSCDQPIGYPIYVSPLTTSYAGTHKQYMDIIKGPFTFQAVRNCFTDLIACLRESCTGSCNSGGSGGHDPAPPIQMSNFPPSRAPRPNIARGSQQRVSDHGGRTGYHATYFDTTSDHGSNTSSRRRDSSQPINDVHASSDGSRSSTSSRAQSSLPTVSRLSLTGNRSLESSSIKRSRPMSHSMNIPQSSGMKKSSHSASTQL